MSNDVVNMIVLGVCMFIGGMAFHSTLAHYLPDSVKSFIDIIRYLLGREEENVD